LGDRFAPRRGERFRTALAADLPPHTRKFLALFGGAVLHGDLAALSTSESSERDGVWIFRRHINSLTDTVERSIN
jgi:hypothetical protein